MTKRLAEDSAVKERVVVMGNPMPLVGVLTEADSGDGAALPTVLLLNAGALHRIGPHRVYVKIARRLAAEGFPVLRFDFSGLGDSPRRRDNLLYAESTIEETQTAMDFLAAEIGARTFVPAGFCGGAEVAFRAACADARIVGAALVDWYAYPTIGWWLRHYVAPLTRPSGWWRLLRGRGPLGEQFRRFLSRRSGPRVMNDGGIPLKDQTARQLQALLARDVRLLYVSTGGQLRYYNYRRQLEDAFRPLDLRSHVQVDFLADSDHTLTLVHHQERVIDAMARWLRASWPTVVSRSRASDRAEVLITMPPEWYR
jgi:pimeloyl-ACP methyl ester carboxylesterase